MKKVLLSLTAMAGLIGMRSLPTIGSGPSLKYPTTKRPTYSTTGTAFTRGKRHRSQQKRANRRKAKAKR